ncbi:hypothetical protein CISIN_1g048694mg, partial [Citrus sinensis]
ILIGCDGASSVVADFLKLKPKKAFASCAVRAFTDYPNGHGLPQEIVRMRNDHILCGTIPINDKLLIRSLTLETIKNFPAEKLRNGKDCDLSSLSFTHFRYRAPWDILLGRLQKGTVTVAGDSMHVMAPFIGQGGSAGIEDAVVLARCLARNTMPQYEKIGEALDEYVKERRTRLLDWLLKLILLVHFRKLHQF